MSYFPLMSWEKIIRWGQVLREKTENHIAPGESPGGEVQNSFPHQQKTEYG